MYEGLKVIQYEQNKSDQGVEVSEVKLIKEKPL